MIESVDVSVEMLSAPEAKPREARRLNLPVVFARGPYDTDSNSQEGGRVLIAEPQVSAHHAALERAANGGFRLRNTEGRNAVRIGEGSAAVVLERGQSHEWPGAEPFEFWLCPCVRVRVRPNVGWSRSGRPPAPLPGTGGFSGLPEPPPSYAGAPQLGHGSTPTKAQSLEAHPPGGSGPAGTVGEPASAQPGSAGGEGPAGTVVQPPEPEGGEERQGAGTVVQQGASGARAGSGTVVQLPKPEGGEERKGAGTVVQQGAAGARAGSGTVVQPAEARARAELASHGLPEELKGAPPPEVALHALEDLGRWLGCPSAPQTPEAIWRLAQRTKRILAAFSGGLLAARQARAALAAESGLALETVGSGSAAEPLRAAESPESVARALFASYAESTGAAEQEALSHELEGIPRQLASVAQAQLEVLPSVLAPLAPDRVGLAGKVPGYKRRHADAVRRARQNLLTEELEEAYHRRLEMPRRE